MFWRRGEEPKLPSLVTWRWIERTLPPAAARTPSPPASSASTRMRAPIAERFVRTPSGLSLHAKVRLDADDHDGRERLARYLARPAIASERLSLDEHGRVVYRLRRHWKDGTRAVAFQPLDFIARLAALVPRPRNHS
jgi:hypothetical protein